MNKKLPFIQMYILFDQLGQNPKTKMFKASLSLVLQAQNSPPSNLLLHSRCKIFYFLTVLLHIEFKVKKMQILKR